MLLRRLDLVVTLLLLLALMAVALSGILADYLGTPRSLYHRPAAYSLAILSVVHIVSRRRQMWSRIKAAMWRGSARKCVIEATAEERACPRTSGLSALSRRSLLISGPAALAGFLLGRWLPLDKPKTLTDGMDLGLAYHQWSKPGLWGMLAKPFQWGMKPPLYKDYSAGLPRTVLPGRSGYQGLFVEEAIQRRRSIREYSGQTVSLEKLSILLHSAYGITEASHPLRASPSAGAEYPLEIYPVVNRVDGLASGVYHYRPAEHALELIKEGDQRSALLSATGGQDMVLKANTVVIIAAVFQRTRWRYQDRAYRYVMLDAGHVGQNLYLAATSLGLGACGIGAFPDDEANRLVEVDGEAEAVVYIVSIGTPE